MKMMLLFVLVCISSTSMAGFYKCKSDDGKVVYQSTVCSSGKQQRVSVDKPSTNQSEGYKKQVVDRCVAGIANSYSFADPDSLLAKQVKGKTAAVIDYMGTKIMANIVVVAVNSKNMYGAYSGYKTYRCYMSPASGKVLKVGR